MATEARTGKGVLFKRGDGASSETFTTLSEVNNISGPNMARDMIDATSFDSTGGYREYIAGFRDGDTMVVNMNWTRDNYIAMLDDFEDDDPVNYQIVIPDTGNTTFDISGFVQNLPMTIPTDDKMTMEVTIKITGQVTVTS